MSNDARGWRMALVPDSLVNGHAGSDAAFPGVLGVVEENGYGLLQLPPPDGKHGLLLAVIADQVAEYVHHGYAVVAVGLRMEREHGLHWRRFASLLRHRGVPLPPRHVIGACGAPAGETRLLTDFLSGYDVPAHVQSRWRV